MTPEPQCPLCGAQSRKTISASFARCADCGIIFNLNFKSLSYDRDYFISEYKEQYGRTYIEDFAGIYSMAKTRLSRILKNFNGTAGLSILDIGSAAGFFLKAAKDSGIETLLGIEISEFAADYCRDNFSIEVIQAPFGEVNLNRRFSVISSWFFLEHMAEPAQVIGKIYSMLEEGGVFACGVPSFYGPSFHFNRKGWMETHPQDHRIDLSPSSAKRILKQAGFRRVKVCRAGYHPERVLKKSSLFYPVFEPVYNIFTRVTAYSDTIEIYAVK